MCVPWQAKSTKVAGRYVADNIASTHEGQICLTRWSVIIKPFASINKNE